ncbi:MAG: trypsin-like peptidase domain-containing protein [Holosporales bacterium]|jgi:serine protease Do|nr:trypsin-like peptidase domain-containing protein [Holosporales bacterium]
MSLFRFIINVCKAAVYVALIIGVIEGWHFLKREHIVDLYPGKQIRQQQHHHQPRDHKFSKSSKKPSDQANQDKAKKPEQVSEPGEKDQAPQPNESSSRHTISFENGFTSVAKKAINSVVSISVLQLIEDEGGGINDLFRGSPFDDFFKDFFDLPERKRKPRKAQALGSGFIVQVNKDTMYIVTNNHVIDKAKKILITFADKTEVPAELHAADPRTDIAVISVNLKELQDVKPDMKKLKPITWGDSDKIAEGQFVVAIGNPFGFGNTVTSGIISSKGRNVSISKTALNLIDDYIQHSAQINMGSSGGCLLDIYGKVIGINNAIITPNGGNIGIGFAIPSNIAQLTVRQLILHKRTFRGWLGVEIQKVGAAQAESIGLVHKADKSEIYGVFVAKLVKNGPAAKAGVKVGDVLIEFNGQIISKKNGLQTLVGETPIGKTAKLKVWRSDEKDGGKWKELELEVKVGDFEKAIKDGSLDDKEDGSKETDSTKSSAKIEALGITVAAVPDRYRNEYPPEVKVLITQTEESDEPSFTEFIFVPGDGIVSANNVPVRNVAQFERIIKDLVKKKERRPIPFVLIRRNSRMFVATTLNLDKAREPEKADTPEKKGKHKEKDKEKNKPKK